MKWASAMSHHLALDDSMGACARDLRAQLAIDPSASPRIGPAEVEPDLVLVFTSMHYVSQRDAVASALRAHFPKAVIFGCTGAGVIGAGHEAEEGAAVSVTAAHLPGVRLAPFHVDIDSMPSPDAPPEVWHRLVGLKPDLDPHFLLLADPFSLDAEALVGGLDFAFPGAAKIGGLASGAQRPGEHVLYLNAQAYRSGAVGIALAGNIVADTVVAQGCRPIGEVMRVTEADRNTLVTLDGKPAIEVLQETFVTLDKRGQELAQRSLFLGIAMDPLIDQVQAGDFLVRNIMGADTDRGALAVGALLSEGQLVQFHVRDAETSADDLRSLLEAYRQGVRGLPAVGALLFSCTGRGRGLYGEADHDTGLFHDLVGELPLGGFFCNGEIGPVAGTTHLHSYTSSFGLFRPRVTPD